MDDFEITWYMQELSMHSLGVEHEFMNMLQVASNPETRQQRLVWFHLTSCLAHAAMISKYLSPVRPQGVSRERKRTLRRLLEVADDSEILSRKARDNIEHFDERIDNWVGNDCGGILEVVLPNRGGYEFLDGDNKRIKRVLLAEELIFITENRDGSKLEIPLEPVVQEAKRIGSKAGDWIQDNSPYHFIYPGQQC